MGEEWGATQPFCFFTDFHDDLADAVREGRRREFKKFPEFASDEARAHIPDPNDPATFTASRIDWSMLQQPEHADWLSYTAELLRIRQAAIVPLLPTIEPGGSAEVVDSVLRVAWPLDDGRQLMLIANLAAAPVAIGTVAEGALVFQSEPELQQGSAPPWFIRWLVAPGLPG
jgi:1,4-alpha-glucan branching enzyme